MAIENVFKPKEKPKMGRPKKVKPTTVPAPEVPDDGNVLERLDTIVKQTSMLYQLCKLMEKLTDTKVENEVVKQGLIQQHNTFLSQLVEGQKTLTDAIVLLTAKGVAKAKRAEKPEEPAVATAPPAPLPPVGLKVVPPPPAPLPVPVPTLDQLRGVALAYSAKTSPTQLQELLKRFGVTRVSELPPSQYENFAKACGS
jgi:hypothetical protein